MKKHNLRGNIIGGAILAFGIFFINNTVYAEPVTGLGKSLKIIDPPQEYCTGITNSSVKKNCQNAVKLCKNILTSEVDKYKIDIDLDMNNVFTYSITGNTGVTSNIAVKSDGNDIASGTKMPNDFNMITFSSDLSATKSYDGDGGTPISCTGKFEWTNYYNNLSPVQSNFENPSCKNGGICKTYLDGGKLGKYKIGDNNYDLDKEYSFKKLNDLGGFTDYFKKYLPYCDCDGAGKEISDMYNDDYIKSQIVNVARSFKISKDVEGRNLQTSTLPQYQSVRVDSTKQSFVCDAFATNNERKFYKVSEPKIITYNNTMNGTSPEVCRVECSEEVTVNYNPPVAVKGSICFEYEIEVKSKTNCALTRTNLVPPTPPVRRSTCQMQVRCNSHSGIISMQAGPNEDFDDCVSEKFNGKYTQKAINYCYNKVYKKNKTKKLSYNYDDNLMPLKVANSSNNIEITIDGKKETIDYCSTTAMNKIAGITNYNEFVAALNRVADKIYNVATNTNSGNYVLSSTGQNGYRYYNWNANTNSCYWNRYADVYKRNMNVVKSLVYDDEMFSTNKYTAAPDQRIVIRQDTIAARQKLYSDSGYYGNNSLASISYYTGDKGFKVGHYTNNGTTCNDSCVMYTTDNNCIVPGDTDSNYDEAYRQYLISLSHYQDALNRCVAKAECNKDTATYRMSVNPSTANTDIKVCAAGDKNKVGKDCISWVQENSKTTMVDKIEPQKPLKYAKGVCYNSTDDNNDYHNIISFPGTWQRNKDGSFRFTPPANNSGYTYHEKQYCVDPSVGDINIDWWKWDQVSLRSEDGKANVNYSKVRDTLGVEYNKYNGKYNIYGKMEKFGYFNWELDFSCFYAVNNDGDLCSGNDCPTSPKTTITTTNGLKNSDTRTISLDDPFPTASQTASKLSDDITPKKLNNTTTEEKVTKVADSSVGRTPGYNWSCEATNLGIKDYVIAPTALTLKIKEENSKIYDNNSGELDYKIEITSSQIKEIRKYNESHNYFDYKDNYSEQNGIRFYNSSFLSNKQYVTILDDIKPKKLCNNLKSNGTLCDNLEKYIQEEQVCTKLIHERG